MGSLKDYLRKWFFREPWFERFFVEPEMVLLWHHSEEPFPVPDGSYMVLRGNKQRVAEEDGRRIKEMKCSHLRFWNQRNVQD